MMPDDLAAWVKGHRSDEHVIDCTCAKGSHGPYCTWCGNDWPCPVAQIVSYYEERIRTISWRSGHQIDKYNTDTYELKLEIDDLEETIRAVEWVLSTTATEQEDGPTLWVKVDDIRAALDTQDPT